MYEKRNDIIMNISAISDTLSIISDVLSDKERSVDDDTIASSVLGMSSYLNYIVNDIEHLKVAK